MTKESTIVETGGCHMPPDAVHHEEHGVMSAVFLSGKPDLITRKKHPTA